MERHALADLVRPGEAVLADLDRLGEVRHDLAVLELEETLGHLRHDRVGREVVGERRVHRDDVALDADDRSPPIGMSWAAAGPAIRPSRAPRRLP